MAEEEENDTTLTSQFLNFTGITDTNVAHQYLEMSGSHLETAVNLFVEMNAEVGEGSEEQGCEEHERVEEIQDTAAVSAAANVDGFRGSNNSNDGIEGKIEEEEGSLHFSEPDYDYLADDGNAEQSGDSESDIASSPDYDHLDLDYSEEELSATYFDNGDENNNANHQEASENFPAIPTKKELDMMEATTEVTTEKEHFYYAEEEDVDVGEEYILGTMMVRVLQAKHVKHNPNKQGGGIGGLLFNHRRNRHSRSTISPASGGGNTTSLTPSSYSNQQLYAKLSYNREQPQFTSMAMEHINGDYHWSRGDQSYFDVTCPGFPLRTGKKMQQTPFKAKQTSAAAPASPKKEVQYSKPNNNTEQPSNSSKRPSPPILQLSLYSKKSGTGTTHKQNKWIPYLNNNNNKNDHDVPEKNDDYLIGKCSINVLRILSGRTPYFDEWCTIHNDTLQKSNNNNNNNGDNAGRVRIVIEYEPTDPPPRPGDRCVFANVYPLVEELYPIPLYSIRNTVRPVRSSMSMSTLSSTSLSSSVVPSSSSYIPLLRCLPKSYRVEEVVGDHVVLSYQTPTENWQCTFEVHRYLLLCIERHQAMVEKYRERVLDLCDNLSQSPMVNTLTKTLETLPDEGLVYVGTELGKGSVDLLGRWWDEKSVDLIVEDVVDSINLDGRYSHLSDDEEDEEDGEGNDENAEVQNQLQGQSNTMNVTETPQDDRKALPGMPCCPITGLPMIEPVVAADGHTYERHAIARWLQTSNDRRSPLTGEVLAHSELVPNYLLLSSLGNNESKQEEDVGGDEM